MFLRIESYVKHESKTFFISYVFGVDENFSSYHKKCYVSSPVTPPFLEVGPPPPHSQRGGATPRHQMFFDCNSSLLILSREVLVNVSESGSQNLKTKKFCLKKINWKVVFCTFQKIAHLLGQKFVWRKKYIFLLPQQYCEKFESKNCICLEKYSSASKTSLMNNI